MFNSPISNFKSTPIPNNPLFIKDEKNYGVELKDVYSTVQFDKHGNPTYDMNGNKHIFKTDEFGQLITPNGKGGGDI
jgi:hypothetical protein